MKNIVLIGMPGCGKSTAGVVLAKAENMNFVDTDLLIQQRTGEKLQETIEKRGLSAFLKTEEAVILSLQCDGTVIATGGSAVYSADAMAHLKENGTVVFIDAEPGELKERITNMKSRGIACPPEVSFEELYRERIVLYRQYADVTVSSGHGSLENVVEDIISKLHI